MNVSLPSIGRLTATLFLLTGVVWSSAPSPVLAQYTPPDRGLPGRREGGGTRGNGCVDSDRPLTALAPEFTMDSTVSIYGTTVSETPKLYWYVPQVNAQALEFVMLDEAGNELYIQQFPANTASGIVGVEVPLAVDNQAPLLAADQNYHWFFSVVCDTSDRSGDIISEGWVRRIPLDEMLDQQLKQVPAAQQSALYAQAGIWYDALNTAAQQRCLYPDNPALTSQWNTLLTSVGLEGLVDQPLLLTCEMPQVSP